MLAVHSGGAERVAAARARLLGYRAHGAVTAPPALAGVGGTQGRTPLLARLKQYGERDGDPVPPALFRRYVAYARAHCRPALTEEAKAVIREAYLALRDGAEAGGVAASTRALEALVRLSQVGAFFFRSGW